ncbi:alpha/beta hydrolase [Pseudomonas sp. TH41]|uniref:alpha/beta fold hydrolase n=1 Tax=Pseudomonas sp. TH41 TaxID=2796405 RepID=UPI0019137770|nr:alpha/beta hydrolase [Pseudomonas sp. TH41]MBK5356572.1 alpha/beta hydrolase [Pseudomonas sp. TH41]
MHNDRREFLKTASVLALSTTLGSLSTQVAAAPANVPVSQPAAAPLGIRSSVPGKKIELNGVHYHVADQGSGDKVVLLLHGMPDTSNVWDHQIPALVQAGYRVIVPDMLGYGETDKPQDPQRYGLAMIVGDMIALLDALGLKQVDLIGHDWGAATSWELVLNFPERFRRYAALSIGHPDQMMYMNSIAEVKDSWYMYLPTQAAAGALYAANEGAFFKQFIMPTHPEIDEVWSRLKNPEAMLGNLNWDRGNPMATAYLAALDSAAAPRKCSVPTLGLWSSGDAYVWESQVKLSSRFMSAPWRYERIEDASHWMMLDRPQQVNTLLLDWFKNA